MLVNSIEIRNDMIAVVSLRRRILNRKRYEDGKQSNFEAHRKLKNDTFSSETKTRTVKRRLPLSIEARGVHH